MPQQTAPQADPASNASKRRRERERLAMRARLLAVAGEIAAEEGWPAVTIRKIADRLEYASPILYQYFAGKAALLMALLAEGFREGAELLGAASEGPAEGILERLAIVYWDFAFSAPELYQAMNGLDGVPFGTEDAPHEARQGFAVVQAALQRLASHHGPAHADPQCAVDTVWAFMPGSFPLT